MIKEGLYQTGAKSTPKKKAQDLLMHSMAILQGYWAEDSMKTDDMTPGELNKVHDQLRKECDRIARRFGYDASWSD